MINRIKNFLMIRLGKTTPEESELLMRVFKKV